MFKVKCSSKIDTVSSDIQDQVNIDENYVLTSVLNFSFKLSLVFGLDFLQVMSQVLTQNSRPKSGRDLLLLL